MSTDPDNSFVKQSLSGTLQGSTHPPTRSVPKPVAAMKGRRLIDPKDMAIRKAKAEEESGGILKSLGLAPSPRSSPKPSDHEAVIDWEQVGNREDTGDRTTHLNRPTPELPHRLSPLPLSSANSFQPISSSTTPPKHLSSPPLTHPSPPKVNESAMLNTVRRQLAEAEKARDEFSLKCTRLEHELNEIKDNKTKTDGKILEAGQYQELERQFDEQEKLLSGYQRENERSLIELEATKVKMLKMGNLLSKVYGPDWEEAISNMNDSSPGGTMRQNSIPRRLTCSSPSKNNTIAIPNTPSEKLSLQLAQVQLLVQGMERKLVSREAELENLHKQTREEHHMLQESINRIGSKPPSRQLS